MGRLVLVMGVTLAACGGSDPPNAPPTPAASPTPTAIVVTGTIEQITFGTECGVNTGRRLTWYDGEDNVIGTVTSTRSVEQDFLDNAGVCQIIDTYEVELPRADFYRAEVVGIPTAPDPVSFVELEAMGFEYNLTVDTS